MCWTCLYTSVNYWKYLYFLFFLRFILSAQTMSAVSAKISGGDENFYRRKIKANKNLGRHCFDQQVLWVLLVYAVAQTREIWRSKILKKHAIQTHNQSSVEYLRPSFWFFCKVLHIRCSAGFWIHLCYSQYSSLREKCPNTEFFLVPFFPCSNWIPRFTE